MALQPSEEHTAAGVVIIGDLISARSNIENVGLPISMVLQRTAAAHYCILRRL
jgi:hypothetical protein